MSAERCEAKVWDPNTWHRHRCQRAAKELVGVAWYCTQHAKIARRRIRLGIASRSKPA